MTSVPAVITSQPIRIGRLLRPWELARVLYGSRDLVRQFTVREVLARHRGTSLGFAWAVLQPALLLAVYTLVFGVILGVRWGAAADDSRAHFALAMFAGMVAFTVFSETVVRSCSVIVNAPNYVKKVVFPLEIMPLSILGAQLVYAGIGVVVLLAGWAIVDGGVSRTLWAFPVVLVPLVTLSAGVAWLVASLGVFLRDISQVIDLVVRQALIFLTPVFYPAERVPYPFDIVLRMNPLTPVVTGARRTLVEGGYPDWGPLLASTVLGLLAMQLGFAFFMKSKRGFADVL